jgi:hypothetical protein
MKLERDKSRDEKVIEVQGGKEWSMTRRCHPGTMISKTEAGERKMFEEIPR